MRSAWGARRNRLEGSPSALFIWKNKPNLRRSCLHHAPPLLGLCSELTMWPLISLCNPGWSQTCQLSYFCFPGTAIIDMDHHAWLFSGAFHQNSHAHTGAKKMKKIQGIWWNGLGREASLGVDRGRKWLSRYGREARFHLEAGKSNEGGHLSQDLGSVLFLLSVARMKYMTRSNLMVYFNSQFERIQSIMARKEWGQEQKASVCIASAARNLRADRKCPWAIKPQGCSQWSTSSCKRVLLKVQQPIQTVLPARDQGFEHRSLWRHFPFKQQDGQTGL